MRKTELPPMTKEPLLHVDMTPGPDLALRLLRAYRHNCDVKWVSNEPNALLDMMNEHCDQRAKALDRAIKILEKHL